MARIDHPGLFDTGSSLTCPREMLLEQYKGLHLLYV